MTLLLCIGAARDAGAVTRTERATDVSWKRTVIDPRFRSEGVAVADVDRDGDRDVLAGEYWYENPTWTAHEIAPPGDYGDGARGYSRSFLCFAEDVNRDGWPDLIVIGVPGDPCYWYENPRGRARRWPAHLIWPSACNESPALVDLFGNGQRVLVMAERADSDDDSTGQLAWFAPGPDPAAPWTMHAISRRGTAGAPTPGTQRFAHGLGAGDVDGDGRIDVVSTEGWWRQPAEPNAGPWSFQVAKLGQPCAQMYVDDLNGDGIADVVSSSAHNYGIWLHVGTRLADGRIDYQTVPLFPALLSETHALEYVDINGDDRRDIVTGKRWWAHGPGGDPGADEPAELYWFEATEDPPGRVAFTPRLIDSDSGVGLQFTVEDVSGDGLPDVVTSNKKGVFLFEQSRRPTARNDIRK